MENTKHTPAPWHIDGSGNICASNGRALISSEAIGGESELECKANARLIATSPLLLAVAELDEALDGFNGDKHSDRAAVFVKHGWNPDGDFTAAEFVREIRRAAIAKATGGQ